MALPDSDPHVWLETDAIWRVSDFALGVIMLLVGVFALWYSPDYGDSSTGAGPGWFPTVVAGLLSLVGVVLLLRASLRRSSSIRRSRPLYIALVAAAIVVLVFAGWIWGIPLFLRFGPMEFMAVVALELAVAIALAHSSRTRAAGMVLLGLLLSTVGIDAITGVMRFTMGVEALFSGIHASIVLIGLFVVGDALVCLVSPPLLLRTYTRLITTWRAARIPLPAAFAMRLTAAFALVGACYYAHALAHNYGDVASVLVFGVLGVAAKIFGWNRFLLCMGSALGTALEQSLRQTLLITQGDLSPILQRPTSAALIVAAAVILTTAVVHSIRRARTP